MSVGFASDGDLHGFVDGQGDPERRGQILRHLAGAPADRVRVEAWQRQNELLRRAFAGVDLEPLPVLLDLHAKPKLQSVPANDSIQPPARAAAPKWRRYALIASMAAIIGGAAIAAHYLNAGEDAGSQAASQPPSAPAAEGAQTDKGLPTSHIPDLRTLGFAFVSATILPEDPESVQFAYRGGDESIVVSVARLSGSGGADQASWGAPQRIGEAFVWRQDALVYALSGSPRAARLRAIAAAMQNHRDF